MNTPACGTPDDIRLGSQAKWAFNRRFSCMWQPGACWPSCITFRLLRPFYPVHLWGEIDVQYCRSFVGFAMAEAQDPYAQRKVRAKARAVPTCRDSMGSPSFRTIWMHSAASSFWVTIRCFRIWVTSLAQASASAATCLKAPCRQL